MRLLIALADENLAWEILCRMEAHGWDVHTARSGREVLEKQAFFDVLLLHHCLPDTDGLRTGDALMHANPICPPRILLLCPKSILDAPPLWADCVVEAGVSVSRLCDLLFLLAQKPLPKLAAVHSGLIRSAIDDFLSDISMDTRFKGQTYTAWLLEKMIPAPGVASQPLQLAYAACGRHFGTSPASVERCVRVAVEQVFTQGSMQGIERYFGATIDPERGKPTNRAFLLQAAQELRSRLLYSFATARSPNKSEMHQRPAAPTSV